MREASTCKVLVIFNKYLVVLVTGGSVDFSKCGNWLLFIKEEISNVYTLYSLQSSHWRECCLTKCKIFKAGAGADIFYCQRPFFFPISILFPPCGWLKYHLQIMFFKVQQLILKTVQLERSVMRCLSLYAAHSINK